MRKCKQVANQEGSSVYHTARGRDTDRRNVSMISATFSVIRGPPDRLYSYMYRSSRPRRPLNSSVLD